MTYTFPPSCLQHFDFPLPNPVRVFEMVLVPQQEYPLVCIGVCRGSSPNLPVIVEYINLNSNTSWFTNSGLGRLMLHYYCMSILNTLEYKKLQIQHHDLNSQQTFCILLLFLLLMAVFWCVCVCVCSYRETVPKCRSSKPAGQ